MKHTRMTSLTSFSRGCYLPSLLRPMLPSVRGFAISSDGYFYLQEHCSTVILVPYLSYVVPVKVH